MRISARALAGELSQQQSITACPSVCLLTRAKDRYTLSINEQRDAVQEKGGVVDKKTAISIRTTEFACTGCGRPLQIPEKYVGSYGKCKFCSARINITVDAEKEIDHLFYGLSEAVVQGAKRIAMEGVEEGKGPADVARKLNIIAELDPYRSRALHDYERSLFREGILPNRMQEMIETHKEKLLGEHRTDIAQTLMHYIASGNDHRRGKSAGAQWKFWMTASDSEVLLICSRNEKVGWIPVDTPFPSGHMYPPGHLEGCRCTVTYRRSPPQAETLSRTRERIDRTKRACEDTQ